LVILFRAYIAITLRYVNVIIL